MPQPTKTHLALVQEGKSHRTKAELKQREEAENALITGVSMRARSEVIRNPIAKKEYERIRDLLKIIEKNDALYTGIINRYAQLYAECLDFEQRREEWFKSREELQREYREGIANDEVEGGLRPSTYYKRLAEMMKSIISLDRQIQAKRKMMLDIERECLLTVASALRAIPKKVEKDDAASGINAFLKKRAEKGADQ